MNVEQFYTSDNLAVVTNAIITTCPAVTQTTPAAPTGASHETDFTRVIPVGVFYDETGNVMSASPYAQAGRIHMWAKQYNQFGSPLFLGIGFLYSDDLGKTFIKPDFKADHNLELVSWNGNFNNNLISLEDNEDGDKPSPLVTVNPDDANYPVKALTHLGRPSKSADGLIFPITDSFKYDDGDTLGLGYAHGEHWVFNQGVYANPKNLDVSNSLNVQRLFNVDKTDPFGEGSADREVWTYGNIGELLVQHKDAPRNKTEDDKSNLAGQWENYMGMMLRGEFDVLGNKVFVLGVNAFDRTSPFTDWRIGNAECLLGVMGDVTDDVYQLVGGGLAIPHGAAGTFDSHQSYWCGGLVETEDSLIGFYAGFDEGHGAFYNPPLEGDDTYKGQGGRALWRKDGLCKMVYTSGSTTSVNIPKGASEKFYINANGNFSIEIQDSGGSPISGFTAAECDLGSIVDGIREITWGGVSLSTDATATIKVVISGDGDFYSYKLSPDVESSVWYDRDGQLMVTTIESVETQTYSAYSGKIFSEDGVSYFRGVANGDSVSVPAIGLTAYSQ